MGTTKKTTRATAPERTDERDGWRRAEVATIVHEVRRHMGRGPVHSITVDLWVTGMSCKSRKFVLDGASAVAEVRAFFALFDFPLTKAEELDAACERASAGELWVQEGPSGFSFLGGLPRHFHRRDPEDGVDIWNHERHWAAREAAAQLPPVYHR